MGSAKAKPEKHILHYHKLDENKLWVFFPSEELYKVYPVFTETGPFFFGNLETISIPGMNRVYIIGGTGFKKMPEYTAGVNPEDLSKYQKKVGSSLNPKEAVNSDPDQPQEAVDLNKETLYARAEKAAEYMTPVDLVGYINVTPVAKPVKKEKAPKAEGEEKEKELTKEEKAALKALEKEKERLAKLEPQKLFFTTQDCAPLKKPRTSHSMVYLAPYIYVIGGVVDNVPVNSCLKYDVKDGAWSDIASIGFYGNLTSPAVVGWDKYLLIFDCYSDTQYIHKYQVDFDVWENIPFNTPGFKIPKSLNSMAFR